MLAVFPGVRTGAGTHAELGGAYEVGPESNISTSNINGNQCIHSPLVVLNLSTESVTEDKSTDGVTIAIGTVRVKLSSFITSLDVDLCEVTHAGYLNVVLGANEVNTLEGAIGDHTGTTAALGTPSDLVPLRVADCADRGGCPETEIIRVVHPHCLAHGRLRGCSTAVVGSCLTAFGLVRELIVAARECEFDAFREGKVVQTGSQYSRLGYCYLRCNSSPISERCCRWSSIRRSSRRTCCRAIVY